MKSIQSLKKKGGEKEMFGKRGLAAAVNVVDMVMGIIILVIMIAAAAIPVIQDTLDNANITGIPATILSLVPVFLALLALIAVSRAF